MLDDVQNMGRENIRCSGNGIHIQMQTAVSVHAYALTSEESSNLPSKHDDRQLQKP
jgi:hypothetical protein